MKGKVNVMLEYEYKYQALKSDFERIRSEMKKNKKAVHIDRRIQINYYYDTENLVFQSKGITVRVRQKENGLKLQLKRKNYYGENRNLETETDIQRIPNALTVEGCEVTLKGQLVTDRTRYVLENGIKLDLDVNLYCGIVDYEIEAELPDSTSEADIPESVRKLIPAEFGKAARFYKAKAVLDES